MSDLSELFARDPLLLTDSDISIIIQRLRENQAQYELGTKAAAPKAAKKIQGATGAKLDLLKDLGLA